MSVLASRPWRIISDTARPSFLLLGCHDNHSAWEWKRTEQLQSREGYSGTIATEGEAIGASDHGGRRKHHKIGRDQLEASRGDQTVTPVR